MFYSLLPVMHPVTNTVYYNVAFNFFTRIAKQQKYLSYSFFTTMWNPGFKERITSHYSEGEQF